MPSIDRERWLLLEPLVSQALELEGDERAHWLAVLHTTSPDLAADVAELVSGASSNDSKAFLATPLISAVPTSLAGLEVGGYRLEYLLGSGGMGSVWRAHRDDGRFDATVAVKLLNLSLLTPTGQERFRREGTVLARLTHAGIARLLDAGVTAVGQPYLVLEHIDGVRIDDWVAERRLPQREIIALILQLLDAVSHAHANLVVHRDIKPSNILVSGDGKTKLLDFGIAKLLDVSGSQPALTADGGRLLTPDYAAPEQARGEEVTTATDVYAVAVLLYVLLSGRHPTAPPSSTSSVTLQALFDVTPPRLGVGDLDTILQKALRKDPRERYQTATSFADDLTRYLRFEPVAARPDSLGYRLARFVRRNRAGVGAGAVVAASLVGATLFSVGQLRETQRQRDAAIEARTRADMQVEFQKVLMSEVGDGTLTLRGLLAKGRAVLEQQYGGDPRTTASLLEQLATSYNLIGDEQSRTALLARAESLSFSADAVAQHAAVRCQIADARRIAGKGDDARRLLDAAQAELRTAPDDHAALSCLSARMMLEGELGTPEAEIGAASEAIAIVERNRWTRSSAYPDLLSSLAGALDGGHRVRESIQLYRRAIAVADSTGWGTTSSANVVRHNFALVLGKVGATSAAENELHESILGALRGDPASNLPVQPLIHYAHIAFVQNDLDSARKYFELLEARATAEGSAYWQTRATFGLARTLIALGDVNRARRVMARYAVARPKVERLSTDDQLVNVGIVDAEMALLAGRPDTALAMLSAVLVKNGFPDKGRRQQHAALMLASEAAMRGGKPQEALAFATAAIRTATLDSITAPRSFWVGDAMLMQARAQLITGDSMAARESVRRALAALRAGAGPAHPRVSEAEALLARLTP